MICKYCNYEMKEGFIPTGGSVRWIPKGQSCDKLFFRGSKEKEGFRIGPLKLLGITKQPAWYCPNCDLILIVCKANTDTTIS